jgi:hypothetical protein
VDEETRRQIAERDAELSAAISGRRRRTPAELAEHSAWYERVRNARRAADVCAQCEREIEEDEPVYVTKLRHDPDWRLGPVCMDCAPVYIPVWIERDGYGQPCEACGRRVAFQADEWVIDGYDKRPGPERQHVLCSEVCAYRYYNRLRSERSATARAGRSCEACGSAFDAVRSDQRYCSPACKQRAYRQRVEAISGSSPRHHRDETSDTRPQSWKSRTRLGNSDW